MTDWGLLLTSVSWVFTTRAVTSLPVSHLEWTLKLCLVAQPIWTWALVFLKNSIAFMYLRIFPRDAVITRYILYATIAIQVTVGIYMTIFQLTQCIPIRAAWTINDPVGTRCWSERAGTITTVAVSMVHVLTDIMFSLLPIKILRKIRRPLPERIIIGVLMGLGLIASCASIAKMVATIRMSQSGTGESLPIGIKIGLWSILEEQLGLIAACSPPLKPLFHAILLRTRVIRSSEKEDTDAGPYGEISGDYQMSTTITANGGKSNVGKCAAGQNGVKSPRSSRHHSTKQSRGRANTNKSVHSIRLKRLASGSSRSSDVDESDSKVNLACFSDSQGIMRTTEVTVGKEIADFDTDGEKPERDGRLVTEDTIWDPVTDRYLVRAKEVSRPGSRRGSS